MPLFLALIGGLLVLGLNIFNATLSEETNLYLSCLVYHFTGLLFSTILIYFHKSKSTSPPPFHYYLAGVFSVLTVILANYSIVKIGAALTISLSLIGQLILSASIDHFGWLERKSVKFTPHRLLGIFIMALGALIMGGQWI